MRDYMAEARENFEQSRKSGDKKGIVFSVCPETFKKPCKMCDLCKAVLFHKDRYSEQDLQQARDLNRKKKFYANMYLQSNPSEVIVFEYGPLIGDKLSAYEMAPDSDLKGFTDPRTGRNLRITKIPNANPKLTKYDVEPRLTASSIPDMSILNKMYDLDNIIELMRTNQVKTMYQSKLPDGTTEVRILPSWLGPKYSSVFQLHYFLHYGISEEDMLLIQKGELNPLESVLQEKTIVLPKREVVAPPTAWAVPEQDKSQAPKESSWTLPEEPKTSTGGKTPVCFGTYDDDEPDCIVSCKKQSPDFFEKCKKETEERLSQRVKAKGLYR